MMIVFWILFALMTLIALGFIVWPLLRRRTLQLNSQSQANLNLYQEELRQLNKALDNQQITPAAYKSMKSQLETRLLDEVPELEQSKSQTVKHSYITAAILILFVSIFSVSFYFHWGDSKQLAMYYFEKSHAKQIAAEIKQYKNPQQLIEQLQAVLAKRPDSAQGWFLLGRLYSGTQQYDKAEEVFAKAANLKPDDLTYQMQYAQADFFAHDKKLTENGEAALQQVLQKQPNNPVAINLLALNAFSNKNYQQAILQWQKLLNMFPANTKVGEVILDAIHEAQQKINQ